MESRIPFILRDTSRREVAACARVLLLSSVSLVGLGVTPAFAGTVSISGGGSSGCTYDSMSMDSAGNITVNCPTQSTSGPTIGFSSGTYAASASGTATVTVSCSGTGTGNDSVQIQDALTGTATPNTDYGALSASVVTFNTCNTSKPVTFTTSNAASSSKTVKLSLSNPSASVTPGTSNTTVTIAAATPVVSGNCPAYDSSKIIDFTWYNTPGNSRDTALIAAGDSRAYRFTTNSTAFPRGAALQIAASANSGGTAGMQAALSTCPGDFNVATICKVTVSSANGSIYMMNGACSQPLNGTYYLNLKPTGTASSTKKIQSQQL